jgi:hypothetical protein
MCPTISVGRFSIPAVGLLIVSFTCPTSNAQGNKVPPARQDGIRIESAKVGWPAQQAGLESGDVIISIDGRNILSESQFIEAIERAAKLKKALTLTVVDVRTGNEVVRKLSPSQIDGKLGIVEKFIESNLTAKIRQLFRETGFSPETMPIGAFDAKKQDPLFVYISWCRAKYGVAKLLKRELALDDSPYLDLQLVKVGERFRFSFAEQSDVIKKVLRRVLPCDDDSFLDFVPVAKMVLVEAMDFLPRFRSEKSLNFGNIERDLVDFSRPGVLKLINVTPRRKDGDYVYIESAWKESDTGRTKGGRFVFRLIQGVRKHDMKADVWRIFVWFDIKYLPNSEFDPNRGIDPTNSDVAPDLALRLSLYASVKSEKIAVEDGVREYVMRGGQKRKVEMELTNVSKENSSLLGMADDILGRTKVMLCGKSKEKNGDKSPLTRLTDSCAMKVELSQ